MLVFRNPGLIDIRAITTFGVSAKDNEHAVGFFGTGLKYAIAILLRHHETITLFVGGEQYTFFKEAETIRGKSFELVYVNHLEGKTVTALGFTTELGKTWELWQAFRELYCNTMDERGTVYHQDGSAVDATEDETVFLVSGLDSVWAARDAVVLPRKRLLFSNEVLEVHAGETDAVYYRGIKAGTLSKPNKYTYNILRQLDLSEDRLIKYSWQANHAIAAGLAGCDQKDILATVLLAEGDYSERHLDYAGNLPSGVFMELVRDYAKAGQTCNLSAIQLCRDLTQLDHAPVEMLLDAVDTARLRRAVAFCTSLGFPVSDYNIKVYPFLGDGVMGQADCINKTIMLTELAFQQGTKMLAGTLLEEWAHIRYGHGDCTRAMQNWLLDNLCSLGERILGEPL